ncbi:MAG: hypothetical protein ACPLXP_00275 [Microgenomates group bacterium]
MKLKLAKIVSASNQRGWSQVHTFLPEEKEKLETRGQFLAVMGLGGLSEGVEIASAGRELISRLHEEYYGSLEERPFVQLKKAVERVFKEASSEAKIEIVAGALVGDVLYLAAAGGGKVILRRGGEITTILQGNPDSLLVETASGYLQKGDVFLLGTKRFFEVVGREIIQAALASGSIDQVVEALSPVVLGKEEGLASAVIARAEEEKEEFFPPAEKKPEKMDKREALRKFILKIKTKITERPTQKPKKSLFTVALILFLILGVSMVFGARQRKRQAVERKIAAVLEEVKAKKEEGEAILSLNPAKAREILKEAEGLLKQIEEEKISSPPLEKIKQELETSLGAVLREYEVEAKLFFDLELIKKGAVGSDFSLSGSQLVILDSQNLAVYWLGIADKRSAILAGGKEMDGANQVAAFWPKVFVLGDKGIYQASRGNLSLVVEKDKDWQEIRDLGTFGGNLYLLDKKNIWLYPASVETSAGQAGFGAKRGWLKGEADFSNAVGMAIDGAIWVLKSDGKIEKYLRGAKEAFGTAGLDKAFSQPAGLYTSPDEERLYVLDKGNSRIVVLDKNGEYYAQYKNPQIASTQNLVVSEKEKKIFLLGGNKIFLIEMKN